MTTDKVYGWKRVAVWIACIAASWGLVLAVVMAAITIVRG